MAKLSKAKMFEQIQEVFKYRWEFVRRNPAYQEACKKWDKFEAPSWDTPKSPFMEIFNEFEFPPLNYELDYKQLTDETFKYTHKKELNWFKMTLKERESYNSQCWVQTSGASLMVCMLENEHFSYKEDLDNTKLKDPKYRITLSIDIRYPIKMILAGVETEIFTHYAICHMEEVQMPVKRKRLSHYDKYLKIFDAKTTQKITYDQLAKQVYPKDYDKALGAGGLDYDSLIVRVKREYKEAKKLVNGGYKDIR